MKSIVFCTVALALSLTSCKAGNPADLPEATASAPDAYAGLLKKYVTPDGVRYAAWHGNAADIQQMEEVTSFYANTLPPKETKSSLAWHINAYNAWILHNILAKYPTKGALAGEPLFFHAKRIVVSGQKTSFDHFEQKVIRPQFKESRVHFALNCASASCPPLAARPFEAATLDEQLEKLTKAFVNDNPRAIQVSGQAASLSKIFDWYKDDFAASGGVLTFINRYRRDPLPSDAKIKFQDYDWSLNETK